MTEKDDSKPEDIKPTPLKQPENEDKAKEVGGRSGPEPTRYGDWEKNGIISDF
ncbi:MAG: DUF1674 domain-containing protein [Kordiimonas sp.]